jgi:hypothetical protein
LIFLLGGYHAGGKGVCGRLMFPAHETQSMREIRLLRGRLPRKGGGLTGMLMSIFIAKYWRIECNLSFCNLVLLVCDSVDKTFCMKSGSASYDKCVSAPLQPYKTTIINTFSHSLNTIDIIIICFNMQHF